MRLSLALMLALVAMPCFAAAKVKSFKAPVQVAQYTNANGTAKIIAVADIFSDTKDPTTFIQEIAPYLSRLTERNQAEFCASLATNDKGMYAARITTSKTRSACPITDAVPPGYKDARSDVHTHVDITRYQPTKEEKIFLQQKYGPNDFVRTYAHAFSDGDLQQPNAYLVTNKVILYFPGGTEKDIEVLWEEDETP